MKARNEKGQITIEFMIMVAALFIMLLFVLFVYSERNERFIYQQELYEAKLLADKLASAVNAVYLAGDGTEMTIAMEALGDYNVSILNNAVQVAWRDNYVDSPVLLKNATLASITLGQPVRVKIANIGGELVVENA